MEKRARNFCGTLHSAPKDGTNEEEAEKDLIERFNQTTLTDSALWVVAQLERGAEGKLHIQWSGALKNAAVTKATNLGKVAERFGYPKSHVEVMRGNTSQARAYCTKTETREPGTEPKEVGIMPVGQGSRQDVVHLVLSLKNGDIPWDEVDEQEPFLASRHHGLIRRLYVKEMQKLYRKKAPKCYWLWGETGSGKSYDSFHKYSKPEWLGTGEAYLKSHNGGGKKWWDGFDPMKCKTLILNEYRGGLEFSLLMQIADEHPMKVAVRGEDDRPLLFDTLVVNSVMHPRDVYKGVFEGEGGMEPYGQLERRFTIIEKKKPTAMDIAAGYDR